MDASLNKMEKRPDGSADAEMTRLIAATIRNRVPEAENILLTGDIAGDQLTALGEVLKASGELDGKNILVSGCILQSSATVSEAAKADVVVLAADCAVSTHAAVRAQKAKFESFGKKVLWPSLVFVCISLSACSDSGRWSPPRSPAVPPPR